MLAAAANKMIGSEYVYLFIQTSASGFGTHLKSLPILITFSGTQPFWDGNDAESTIIKDAARSVLIVS